MRGTPQMPEAIATRKYFDREFGKQAIKLLPNEYYVTGDDVVLTTVLGSCVAACIRDEITGVGGMNHFMLPDDENAGADRMLSASMRYGCYALEVLINELLKMGARRERLEAKVFGGGAVLANMTTLNIGDRNADFVLKYLRTEEIRVAAQDLRGPHARRVSYFPKTGLALVRRLTRQDDTVGVERDERALARALSTSTKAPARGAVALFTRQATAKVPT